MNLNEPKLVIPKKLMVFYSNGYSEVSDIDDVSLAPKSFRPLCNKEILNITELLNKSRNDILKRKPKDVYSFKGVVSRQILELNITSKSIAMSWVVPSEIRTFNYYKKKSTLYYPGLIFRLVNNNLYVYSYKGKYRTNSIIYRAPFPNISINGSVCLGNTSLKSLVKPNLNKTIKNIEHFFFNSSFTHTNGNVTKSDMKDVLDDFMGTEYKFPSCELIQYVKSFKDVISS